ncbi:hypothetical protein T265_08772 [Opisthorchis viverrini]|uniref:Trematode PH-like domain-containing protein n=1 Tax=Opisthorchis viverrini TaxID=6198 RepID=A0A074ZCJ3_OPIVI|nr:hypothetical protein T265_08772 [Opisthorchis viverrini]KER23327.1 hypothetical protein T265_08772 [Opisthorchis viverrini]
MSKDVEINPYINYPVDKKSRQVVNKEIPVAQIGRTQLKGADPFNEATANGLLEKHLKGKKKKPEPVLFLVDRMRFKKKGNREYLSYREIQNFQRFPNHPELFMLYVVEEKNGKRSYETYTCNNPSDVQAIRDMINAANNDPKRLLQDVGPTRLLSISSSSSSEYYIDTRSYSRASRPTSVQYVQQEPAQYVYMMEPETQVVYQKTSTRPVSIASRSSAPAGEVTYLRSDNINGPQIMDHGPVYMYVSRSKQSLGRDNYSPEYSRRTYY